MTSDSAPNSPVASERKRSAEEPPAEAPEQKKAPPPKEPEEKKEAKNAEKKEPVDLLRSRAGGAYIPPAKLRMMQEQIADKNSEEHQRMNWERLKKKIHGQVNKVNVGNLVSVVRDLLQENIIRGKGLLVRSIIQAQAFSPTFSHVYAALVAVINSKFPKIGELLVKRLVIQFKRAFRFNNKIIAVTVSKFLAHLVNQQVTHEILALEILIVLLEKPTSDSIEVAIAFLKECGAKLSDISPKGLNSVFDRLRTILNEADIDTRVKYMIETIFHIRKDKFRAYPALTDELDLIDEEDQVTHVVNLEDSQDAENGLNVFKLDPNFEENEANYEEVRKQIIGSGGETSSEDEGGDEEDGEEAGDAELAENVQTQTIIDNTEQHMVAFRRKVYLSIQSSLDFQEAAHKLLKNHYRPGLERELCYMIVDCCAQERTYNRFFGLLAERFCRLKKEFQECFESSFRETYDIIHRFDITKLRNVVQLFSHLLATDAISWNVLSGMKMSEDDMTSASRVFVKQMFQNLSEAWGVKKMFERITDPTMQEAFEGLFPRDNPKNTRFAINFFTLIGLGGLTVDLREHLTKVKKRALKLMSKEEESSSSSSSDSDSSDSDSDTSSSSDSSSSSSDSSSCSSDSDSDSDTDTDRKPPAPPKKGNDRSERGEREKPREEDRRDRRRNRDRSSEEDDRRKKREGDRGRDRDRSSEDDRRKKREEDRGRDRDRSSEDDRRKKREEDRGRDRDRSPEDDRRKKREEDRSRDRDRSSEDDRRKKREEDRGRDRDRSSEDDRRKKREEDRGRDRDRSRGQDEERDRKKRRHDREEEESGKRRRADDDDLESRRRRDRSGDRRSRR